MKHVWWFALAAFVVGAPLIGGRHFFYRDVTRQYEPTAHQLARALEARELPSWNSSTQAGVPLLANLHAGAFAPHVVLTTLLPFHRGYALAVWLALALMGLGWARVLRESLSAEASLVGALVVTLGGVTLGATSYLPLLAGLACIPWQVVATRARRGLVSPLLAVLFAVQVLEGDPSTAVMGAVVTLVLVPGGVMTLACSGVLAMGVSAIQLVPGWELFSESARSTASLETKLAWSLHPMRMLEWFVRLPFGELLNEPYFTRYELARGPDGQPFLLDHGWGIVGALLVPFALARRGAMGARVLLVVGTLLALGLHVGGGVLHTFAPLSFFRFPERWGALVLMGAGVLAAQGVSSWSSPARLRAFGKWSVFVGVVALISAALTSLPLFALGLSSLLVGFAVLISRSQLISLVVLLSCGAVDWFHARNASVLTVPHTQTAPDVLATAQRIRESGARVWRDNASMRAVELPARGEAAFEKEVRELERTFASALPTLHGIDELGGYSPVSLSHWQRIVRHFADSPDVLFPVFGVCWVVASPTKTWKTTRAMTPVEQLTPNATLYRTERCVPRVHTVSKVAMTPDVIPAMSQPQFDAATIALVEGDTVAVQNVSPADVTLVKRTPTSLELDVSGTGPRFVVVSETWAPGWTAEVDGRAAEVLRVDGAVMGIALTGVEKRVLMTYAQPGLQTALGISAIALLVLLYFFGLGRAGTVRPGGMGTSTLAG